MSKVRLVMALTIAASGLAACGGDEGGDVRTVTAPAETSAQETPTSAPVSGDAILIETRVTNAKRHTGVVLGGSVIGESALAGRLDQRHSDGSRGWRDGSGWPYRAEALVQRVSISSFSFVVLP